MLCFQLEIIKNVWMDIRIAMLPDINSDSSDVNFERQTSLRLND